MASNNLPSKKQLKKLLAQKKDDDSIPAPPITKTPSLTKRIWTKFKHLSNAAYAVIAVFVTLSGLVFYKDQIRAWIIPRERLWKEKVYINGLSIDKVIIDNNQDLKIIIGGNSNGGSLMQIIPLDLLRDTATLDYSAFALMPGGSTPFDLKFLLIGRNIYISTVFKDIDGKYIGKMNYTEWELRSNKISNYHDGDDNMEIMDDNNYVLFNMQYVYPNTILIHGYYVSNTGVQIATDSNFIGINKSLSNYKESSLKEIEKIKPLNNY